MVLVKCEVLNLRHKSINLTLAVMQHSVEAARCAVSDPLLTEPRDEHHPREECMDQRFRLSQIKQKYTIMHDQLFVGC